MKKILNILSYVLNVALVIILIIQLVNRREKENPLPVNEVEEIKASILQSERNKLPLQIQDQDHVYDIQIDSIVFTNNVEPYVGYMITQWDVDEKQDLTAQEWARNGYKDKYVRKTKQILIELRGATMDKDGTIRWETNWGKAGHFARTH